MKKLLFFTGLILILFLLNVVQKQPLHKYNFSSNAEFVLTTYDKVNNNSYWSVVNGGGVYFVSTTAENVPLLLANVNGFIGQSWKIPTTEKSAVLNVIFNTLKVAAFSVEQVGGTVIYNGYSSLISDFVFNGDNKQNLQIAVLENSIMIGSPLILNSY